jgi:glutamate synthase (ferredoxin)
LEGKSDSASMDMVIELLLMTHVQKPMMMVVPEAWEKHQTMFKDKSLLRIQRLYYKQDGPASFLFLQMVTSLSAWIGCVLLIHFNQKWFRNYVFEIGVLDIKPEDVIQHGRLEPKCFG